MREWKDSERKSAVVASLMLMHRIEAKPSSAPDICATRPRSVQRRVRQQLAQSLRRCFTARQECFEGRHFEVKRNGDVLWAVSCLVARNFDGGVGPPMPSAPTLSTALMVSWRTSGDCVPGALRDHSISFYFWIGVRADARHHRRRRP